MIVFRSETSEGKGPYSRDFPGFFRMTNLHCGMDHPEPKFDDGIERDPKHNEFCGTLNLSDLLEWFDGFHNDLDESGYEISAYDIDDFLIGDSGQVIFERDRAKLVERFSFNTGQKRLANV